uniref:Cilia- and flagella-associated protein 300 n=1 Tax=Eptatretus burgeri TaxID=7764 RepID=A0A8C4N287_EPTBU
KNIDKETKVEKSTVDMREIFVLLGSKVEHAAAEELHCTQLTLNFFDRLTTVGVTRDTGHLIKRFDEPCGDFLISDRLRELAETYSEREKKEFIYVLFRHLCLGDRHTTGSICQLEMPLWTSNVLLMVMTKRIFTTTVIITYDEIFFQDKHGSCYPSPREHEQNFAYLILDPSKHQATVFYHCYRTKTSW